MKKRVVAKAQKQKRRNNVKQAERLKYRKQNRKEVEKEIRKIQNPQNLTRGLRRLWKKILGREW